MRTMRHAPAMHMPCVCHASCQQALKSIDTVKILSCGMAAVATYTSHEKFTYKGSPVRACIPRLSLTLLLWTHVPIAPTHSDELTHAYVDGRTTTSPSIR